MFGLLKSKPAPEGPVEFDLAVEVDRPAAEVYPLIDWADPRNAKRELGHRVDGIDGQRDRFRLTMTEMPDHRFDLTVTEVVPGQTYAFTCDIAPRVGRLVSTAERYSFEPIGGERCKLRLTTVATFNNGLP
jgi:uncharacterized protein YndB with AHSA1/START domain